MKAGHLNGTDLCKVETVSSGWWSALRITGPKITSGLFKQFAFKFVKVIGKDHLFISTQQPRGFKLFSQHADGPPIVS